MLYLFVFVNGIDTEMENICVSGGCFERALSWGLLCREQRNIWIYTMLMSCGTIEWENVTGWKPCVLMFWLWNEARCLQLHCHSQGDTVLVGGPAGEKGNKGETVSEHLDGSKCKIYGNISTFILFIMLYIWFCMLWIWMLFHFRVTGDPKVCREKKG